MPRALGSRDGRASAAQPAGHLFVPEMSRARRATSAPHGEDRRDDDYLPEHVLRSTPSLVRRCASRALVPGPRPAVLTRGAVLRLRSRGRDSPTPPHRPASGSAATRRWRGPTDADAFAATRAKGMISGGSSSLQAGPRRCDGCMDHRRVAVMAMSRTCPRLIGHLAHGRWPRFRRSQEGRRMPPSGSVTPRRWGTPSYAGSSRHRSCAT